MRGMKQRIQQRISATKGYNKNFYSFANPLQRLLKWKCKVKKLHKNFHFIPTPSDY